MESALRVLHAAFAAALVTAHIAFFFRGLPIESGRIKPGRLDHLARRLSQVLLPVAALSGLIVRLVLAGSEGGPEAGAPILSLFHLLLGLAPLAAIPIVFFGRLALKKRRQAPWLLPAVNLILLAAAVGTGILLWR
jgi:hypothetical protein